jgi:hypothetical protein
MAAFELDRDYPLAQILEESSGFWIVPGLVRGMSPSEAVILLRLSENGRFEVVFPSSQACLVRFYCDRSWLEIEAVDQRLRNITKLWVFVVTGQVAALIRVVPMPLSFTFSLEGRSTLTIPMEPSLSAAEWDRLGIKHVAVVTINEAERRYVGSEQDAEELSRHLRQLSSFWLHASRFEGDELDVGADANGAAVFYLNIKRGIKQISMNQAESKRDMIKMNIDALPELDLETERRHLIPLEGALGILRSFLNKGESINMVPWPVDD